MYISARVYVQSPPTLTVLLVTHIKIITVLQPCFVSCNKGKITLLQGSDFILVTTQKQPWN